MADEKRRSDKPEDQKPMKDRYNPVNMAGREAGIIKQHDDEKHEGPKHDGSQEQGRKPLTGKPDAQERPPRRR